MRSLEDITYEYTLTEKMMDFLMEKLAKLDVEHQIAFEREEKLMNKAKKVKEGWGYYVKGELK